MNNNRPIAIIQWIAAPMLKYLPFAFKNILRNRRRTILTVLSVTVSLFLLGVLLAVYSAFYARETADVQALRLVTRNKVSLAMVLPEYYGDRIRQIEGVEAVAIANWFGGIYIDNRPEHTFSQFAVEPEKIFTVRTELTAPPEQMQAFLNDRQGLAVGSAVARRVGLKLGQRITLKGDIYPVDLELTVRAIFEGLEDNETYFHWKYLQESLPEGWRGNVGTFFIRVAGTDDVQRVANAVDAQFRNSPQQTKTETESAFVLSFVNQLGNIKLFLLSIAGAVVFTILLVSANTVAMSVRERIQEIGVLKTLGFKSSTILCLIIGESMAMALTGGILGTALGYVVTQAMRDQTVAFFDGLVLPLWGVPICLGVALMIGLLSSVVPALIASRTKITDALRHSG
jgi:putative ABC transport system permease protein